MIKVEQFGTRQKKTCFGCGSVISFENNDVEIGTGNISYIKCPVCGKQIKARKINREKEYFENNPTEMPVSKGDATTEFGKKVQEAIDTKEGEE